MTTKPRWDTADKRGKRDLVQQEVRQIEESRNITAVDMKQQCSWLNCQVARRRLIWSMKGYRLSFLLRSVLPSPSNLYTWGLIEDPMCTLCKDKPAFLHHVLSCQVALKDGMYTWRHDRVLKTIAARFDIIKRKRFDIIRRKKKKVKKHIIFVNFVKAGESKDNGLGILATATDCQLTTDIQQRIICLSEIAATLVRPDMVL
ncbi:uncharacterized protein [Mytilus edulis]|uniref:uncharacterized protein n=1 Tax=Mytilus edulis TaxID=6550 RepID=UPI0039EEFFED